MAHRYFTTDIKGNTARLTGSDAAHLARALRALPGDGITLCDGAGTDFDAVITQVSPDEVVLRLRGKRPSAVEPTVHATVYIGMAKGERMDWAVQKSVELGAAAIVPFYSDYGVVRPGHDEKKTVRYTRIAHEAAKQCGRGVLPKVRTPLTFTEVLAGVAKEGLGILFYEGGGQPLRELLRKVKRLALITGPEGGFSPAEVEQARAAGCAVAGLGPRILRCETAPVAALSAVMTLTGNLE